MSIKAIDCSDSSILYQMPLGKPNTKQMRSPGVDTRERVKQVQKDLNCSYYVQKMIRSNIGPKHSESLKKEREIEVICSQRRKDISEMGAFYRFVDKKSLVDLPKDKKLPWLMKGLFISEEFKTLIPNVYKDWGSSFRDYVLYKECVERHELNLKFLKKLNLDVEKMYKREFKLKIPFETWSGFKDKMSLFQQIALIDSFANIAQAEAYGLKRSEWKPSKEIKEFIKELKQKGPIAINGKFGNSYYSEEPFLMKNQIGGRNIYAWKPGSSKKEILIGHSILVVGAKIEKEKGYVLFIDPNDESDPSKTIIKDKDCITQRIYMISYENLCKNAVEVNFYPDFQKEVLKLNAESAYGFYGTLPLSKKEEESKFEAAS